MIVIAVDPGKTVGAAVWSERRELEHHGQCDSFDFLAWAEAVIPTYAPWELHVVCERYRLGPESLKKQADFNWATDVIGCLRFWCRKYEVPFVVQDPSHAKSFSTDEKLKKLGWYLPTKGGHANDAARHLLVYLVDQRRVRPSQL